MAKKPTPKKSSPKKGGGASKAKPKSNKTTKPSKSAAASKANDATEIEKPKGKTTAEISKNKLVALYRSDQSHKSEVDSTVASLREKIAYACKHDHLDKEVYAIVKKMARWPAEKLADKWPRLELYMEHLGLMEEIKSAPRLPLGDDEGGRSDDDQTDIEEHTGKPPKPGPRIDGKSNRVSEIAEAAGAQTAP